MTTATEEEFDSIISIVRYDLEENIDYWTNNDMLSGSPDDEIERLKSLKEMIDAGNLKVDIMCIVDDEWIKICGFLNRSILGTVASFSLPLGGGFDKSPINNELISSWQAVKGHSLIFASDEVGPFRRNTLIIDLTEDQVYEICKIALSVIDVMNV